MVLPSPVTYLSPCPCHFLIKSSSQTDGHLVLIAGKPIGEPVVQRGPFVMCTQVAEKNSTKMLNASELWSYCLINFVSPQAELDQAFNDFRRGKNGFEGAVGWRSVEGNK